MMIREKFLAFEEIRGSGVTNMFDYPRVIEEAAKIGVSFAREDFLDILRNYQKYRWEFVNIKGVDMDS